MLIGVDLDNTIASYADLFARVAREQNLTPTDRLPLRDHLRNSGRESRWTQLQQIVYGPRMHEAAPFPGVKDFFDACHQADIDLVIISHRTPDLHASARQWLAAHGFFQPAYLEETQDLKLQRIATLNCTHFIDDLPEFLNRPDFPDNITRILFGPTPWPEIQQMFFPPELPTTSILPPHSHLTRLPGGGNNRVYRVDHPNGVAILKDYFTHPDDPRDRLATEFTFSQFAWTAGIRSLAEPLASDPPNHAALYEFLPGRVPSPGRSEIAQAIDFFRQLNAHKEKAYHLPIASDAAFCILGHIARVQRRISRLDQIDTSSPTGATARQLVDNVLLPTWQNIQSTLPTDDSPLKPSSRVLSPSDFGFHNSLSHAGHLRFIDFEYAGWDDPAKTVCDFFCHPAVPVPIKYFAQFRDAILAGLPDPAYLAGRIDLLLPLFRVEWCCILLNEFLPISSRRRAFAARQQNPELARLTQLAKFKIAIAALLPFR